MLLKGRRNKAARLNSAISPYMWGLDLAPGWHLFPQVRGLGREPGLMATGNIFLTTLEQVPVQGFAGRWLKVLHCAGDQSKDGDPVALMAALGANAGGARGWGTGGSNWPQGRE